MSGSAGLFYDITENLKMARFVPVNQRYGTICAVDQLCVDR